VKTQKKNVVLGEGVSFYSSDEGNKTKNLAGWCLIAAKIQYKGEGSKICYST
jgi:hypothetical protein